MQIFTSYAISPLLRYHWHFPSRAQAGGAVMVNGLFEAEWKTSSKPKHIFGKVANLLSFTEKGTKILGREGGMCLSWLEQPLPSHCLLLQAGMAGRRDSGGRAPGLPRCPHGTVGPPAFLWSLSAHIPQPHGQRGCSVAKKLLKAILEGNALQWPCIVARESSKALHQSVPLPNHCTWPQPQPRGGNCPLNSHISLTASEV